MRRWMVVGGVLALVVVVAIVVALRNASAYLREHREWIAAQASQALGRPVTFGDIGISVWGGLGARVDNLRIGEHPAFPAGEEPFVRAESVRVAVRILPALFGRYEVRELVLVEPAVRLVWTKAGLNAATFGEAGATERTERDAPDGPGEEAAPPLAVDLLSIRDGAVRLVDRRGRQPMELTAEQVDLTLSDFGAGRRARLDAAAAMFGADRQNVAVEGTVGPMGEVPQEAPFDLAVDVDALDLDALGGVPLARELLPAPLAFGGSAAGVARVARTDETVRFEVDFDATGARLDWGETLRKPAGMRLEVAGQGTQADTTVQLDALRTRLADLVVAAEGTLGETLALSLQAEPASLGWTRVLPAAEAVEVGGALGFDLRVSGAREAPVVAGTVSLRDVSAAVPEGLRVEDITTTLTLEDGAAVLPATSMRVDGLPVEVAARVPDLLEAEATGTVRSPGGRVADLTIDGLQATWSASPNAVTARDVVVQVFGGRYEGRVAVEGLDREAPSIASTSRLQGMDMSALLAFIAPAAAGQMTGQLSGQLEVTGTGTSREALLRTLRGQGSVAVDDGVLRGVNLVERVLGGVTGVPGLTTLIPPAVRAEHEALFGGSDTPFDELRTGLRLGDATARLVDLAMAARDYRIAGDGQLGLLTGALEATGVLTASEELTEDILHAVKEVALLTNREGRVEVPFALSGNWPKVVVRPDASGLVRSLQRGLIREGVEELLGGQKRRREPKEGEPEPAPSPAEDLIQKGLEGLFGR